VLKAKVDKQNSDIIEKVKEQGNLKLQVSKLQKRNVELEGVIKKITQMKDGYEVLDDTVADLSLALIGKNEKAISRDQIQLIQNLFPQALLKAVEGFKERMKVLESERDKAML
jgi:hypothetical protein